MASVGSMILGLGRSSTRTSRGPYSTVPRMMNLLLVQDTRQYPLTSVDFVATAFLRGSIHHEQPVEQKRRVIASLIFCLPLADCDERASTLRLDIAHRSRVPSSQP